MRYLVAFMLPAIFLFSCGKSKEQEEMEEMKREHSKLRTEVDSLRYIIRQKLKNLDDKLEGDDDPANQGEFNTKGKIRREERRMQEEKKEQGEAAE